MAMKSLLTQTRREKLGNIDGINLFFGALLGANLGTVAAMPLKDYVLLIGLLVSLVMAIRLVSVSERPLYAHALLAVCIAIFAAILFIPALQPDGLSQTDRDRLAATLAIWVVVTTTVEFYPTRDAGEDQAGA